MYISSNCRFVSFDLLLNFGALLFKLVSFLQNFGFLQFPFPVEFRDPLRAVFVVITACQLDGFGLLRLKLFFTLA